ncbi:carbohydrate-binding protein [Krasilnikovia sp. MM14-A1259]|uniref:carbohydrate-binding protein n=1 Tax=Krasilnikovia sp. MM14-A1259 TaxID=3373539 RepID=UPI0038122FFC
MHRAAPAGRTFLRRPRVLLALAVVGAGLATALYLPSRNDTASAHENRDGRITVCERRDGRGYTWRWSTDRHFRDRECRRTWEARPAEGTIGYPTATPTDPTATPTDPTAPPTDPTPPTSEPPAPSPSVTETPTADPTPTETAPLATEPTRTPPAPEPTATTLEPVKQSATPTPTPTKVNAPKWKVHTAYKAGDLVSFKDKVYRVKEAHTALPGWEPTALPNLFELVG